jgi:hypothetical protein
VVAARKARGAKVAAAWTRVLALDPDHAEARYGIAAAHARGGRTADALAALESLATSSRPDAVEWRVAARFDAAFAALRADRRFRAAVGLDRPAATFYERIVGFGGAWEQAGPSCDTPEVHLDLEGVTNNARFKGRWSIREPSLILALPNSGRGDEEVVCSVEARGDEDTVTCRLDDDLAFTVHPVRR